MAAPINYAQMLEDPDFMMQLQQVMATFDVNVTSFN
jgi:hypothetical protein